VTTMQLLVEAPAITPYQYGLAAVAQPADTSNPHWQMGVEYEPISSYEVGALPGACYGSPSVSLPEGVATVKALPFSLYAGVDCKAVGYDEAYILARAQAILKLGWQHGAEQALWSGAGVSGLEPVLNGTYVATTVGTGLSIVDAVAALEDYLGDNYLGQGVVHATRGVASYAKRDRQVVERAGKLQTVLGTQWAFGGGYDGTGPGDASPATGTTWLYATGLITIRRADPFVNGSLGSALNRTTNDTLVFAEQPTVLTVDGPIAAVSVDLTL